MVFMLVLQLVLSQPVWWGRTGTGTGCDPSALKGGYEGFLRRRSVPCHMISLDASFHWDPRSSSSTKALASPEAASENKGKAVN